MAKSVHSVTQRQQARSEFLVEGIQGDFPLDKAVAEEIHPGYKIFAANTFGSSAWTVTARIDAEKSDAAGKGDVPKKSYFLKCATEAAGKKMMEGEFNAMREIHKTMPSFAPEVYAWGKFQLPEPETYFLLCEFVDMDTSLPDPARFAALLAGMHNSSVSPTGKFGFHVPTCHGRFTQVVDWDSSWASFFTKLLGDAIRLDRLNNEAWPELDRACDRTLARVIPRLLGALEDGDRQVKPSLIHGDLWEGNIGTAFATGDIVIFDAGSYYAHNEMEIGMWRCARHRINSKVFFREYLRNVPPSEPADEWDDRNRLYCVKMNMIHSAHHKGDIVRETAYNDMCYLINKYVPWEDDEKEETDKP